MTGAVIDLGEARDDLDLDAAAPARGPSRALVRWLALLLPALVLAGAAAPAEPRVVLVGMFSAEGARTELVDGGVLLRDGDGLTMVEPDGAVRWRVPWRPLPEGHLDLRSADGRVFVVDPDWTSSDPASAGYLTTAFDLATGERLWQLPGPVSPFEGGLIEWGQTRVRVHEPDGRRLRWQSPPFVSSNVDPHTGSLFALTPDRRLVEYDLATGAVRRSREVALPTDADYSSIVPGADHVAVQALWDGDGADNLMILFDRRTFERASLSGAAWHQRVDCGPVQCATSMRDADRHYALDPASGRVLWSAPEERILAPAATSGSVLTLQPTDARREYRVISQVHAVTGRVERELAGWSVMTGDDGALSPIWLRREGAGPTTVAHYSAAGLRILGFVPGPMLDCQHRGDLLRCWAGAGRVGVWRVTP